jgi:hypothetical protein
MIPGGSQQLLTGFDQPKGGSREPPVKSPSILITLFKTREVTFLCSKAAPLRAPGEHGR